MLNIWKVWHAENRKKEWIHIIIGGFLVFAWLVSYTRGFWFGLAVSVIFVLIWQPKIFGECFKVAIKVLIVTGIIVGISSAIHGNLSIVKEAVGRITGSISMSIDGPELRPDQIVQDSDEWARMLRAKTKAAHMMYIHKSPIIGRGLGAYLVGVRDDVGVTEYTYLDTLMKFGIVGIISFIGAYLVFVPRSIINRIYAPKTDAKNSFYSLITLLIASYVGVLATSYSNPFLISPLGISLLLVVETAVYYCRKFEKEM